MIPHFLDNQLIDGGEVVSLMYQQCFTPQKLLVFIYVKDGVNPRAIGWLEGL
jgi:hypothetical protein